MKYSQLAKRLPKKRAFVTGAGAGLGLAFARALAADNWTLGITDVDQIALDRASDELKELAGPVAVSSYCFDVSDFAAYEQAANQFTEASGGVDLLINNAGIGCVGYLEKVSMEDWHRAIGVNLMGAIHGCKLFLPGMKLQKSGHILNLASAAAIVEGPQASPYNITKASMVALSESLHGELLDFNVRVSVFMPSFIRTDIGTSTIGDPAVRARAMVAVSSSKLSAEWAVDQALSAVNAGKFYIVLPQEIRVLWLFKRLFPETFLKFIATWAKKRALKLDASARS